MTITKIGLFGGTFDPFHLGHLAMAEGFIQAMALDKLWLIPAGAPYHKDAARVAASERLTMCHLIAAAYPKMAASDVDIVRTGNTYTYDTVRIFRQTQADAQWWWLMGADSLHDLPKWYRYRELFDLVNIAVVARAGYRLDAMPEPMQSLIKQGLAQPDSAATGQIRLMNFSVPDIKSSRIRADAAAGIDVRSRLPKVIADYIDAKHLYSKSAADNLAQE